ncbi:unnamed protein product [Protopolystoma xenopodis]|uniref:Uncharacterized protein n=1 Tax=Protopolystoma xenopodis TaxID=117903 RepID=A0A3S5CIG8_9PLAT|nr:unnamed protein product [Protopolystoma xenopodis]
MRSCLANQGSVPYRFWQRRGRHVGSVSSERRLATCLCLLWLYFCPAFRLALSGFCHFSMLCWAHPPSGLSFQPASNSRCVLRELISNSRN